MMRPDQGRALLVRQMVRQCLGALARVPLTAHPLRDPDAAITEAVRFVDVAVAGSSMLQRYWGPDELDAARHRVHEYVALQADHVRLTEGLIDQLAPILARALIMAEEAVERSGVAHVE